MLTILTLHGWATSRLRAGIKRLNPDAAAGQDELFTSWRHHTVFVISPFQMLQAEGQHHRPRHRGTGDR